MTQQPQAPGPMERWNARWQAIWNAIGVAMFAALFVVFVVQVTARFGFNRPLSWTDEVAVILYIWVVLLGAVLVCREREHVAFDLLYGAMPPGVRRGMRMAVCVLVGALMAWAIPETWAYIQFMRRDSTPVLGYSYRVVYFPFLVFLVMVVVRQMVSLVRLMGVNWEAEL